MDCSCRMVRCNSCNGNGYVNVKEGGNHSMYQTGSHDSDGNIMYKCSNCNCRSGDDCESECPKNPPRTVQVRCGTCNGSGTVRELCDRCRFGFREKYLKYKNKYLELKKNIN